MSVKSSSAFRTLRAACTSDIASVQRSFQQQRRSLTTTLQRQPTLQSFTKRFESRPITAAFYHSGRVCLNNGSGHRSPLDAYFSNEMIAEIEYHHNQRDLSNLNLFLKHPSTPKIIGWLPPDLILENMDEDELMAADDDGDDNLDTLVKHQEEMQLDDQQQQEDDKDEDDNTMSCMNRNARYGGKANKGKRPVSRQRRRRKKRSIGNHRR